MVSVRPISELTIAPDGCFALVGSCLSLTIKYEHPGGVAEREDFEAFSHPAGTVIRLEKMVLAENSSWGLTAVLDNGDEYLLHLPAYEDNYDFWENKPLRPHEFLGFLDSVEMLDEVSNNRPVPVGTRCDRNMYGPRLHNVTDGIKPTPLDFSLLNDFFSLTPMININGVSHITSQSVYGIDMSWRNWPCVTLVARTLSGMLRQLCEWKELYLAGLASEYYAEDAHIFIEKLGITEEMIEELKASEVPMPTERFMKGYGNPRHGFVETGNLPTTIKDHLKKQLFYRTLSSLEAQHPYHPEFLETLKEQEKEINLKNLLDYRRVRIPEVSIDELTTQEVYDSHYAQGKYRGVTLPPFGHEIEIAGKGLQAARFFDATS
jgi:hypothetical protein